LLFWVPLFAAIFGKQLKLTGNFGTDFQESMKLIKAPAHPQVRIVCRCRCIQHGADVCYSLPPIKQVGLTIAKRIKALGPDAPKDKLGNIIDEDWTELDLSGWKLDPVTLQVISKLLPKTPSITTLTFVNVQLGMSDITTLGEFLPTTSVTTLNLDCNPRYYLFFQSILNVFTLVCVNSDTAGETKADVYGSRLAHLIGPDSKLTSLSLRSNKIGDKGAIALSQVIHLLYALMYATILLFHPPPTHLFSGFAHKF
jgi:hypothetical protein